MGNCCILKHNDEEEPLNITRESFALHYVIGRGGLGKVWKSTHKKFNLELAVKQMPKAKVLAKKSTQNVLNEQKVLAILKHPFITNMHYAFSDKLNLYLVLDLMTGGDLRYHICQKKTFQENQVKFILACVVLSLEYVHSMGLIHKDLKPDNLLFDTKGYLHLTDFGNAKFVMEDNSEDTSGTPGYIAPEIINHGTQTYAVDMYALGVIAFELITGKLPYSGKSRQEIRDKVLETQVFLQESQVPAK